jgi:hypothetical protein
MRMSVDRVDCGARREALALAFEQKRRTWEGSNERQKLNVCLRTIIYLDHSVNWCKTRLPRSLSGAEDS